MGGLQCCTGGSLLDADQVIPPVVSQFRYKIRVYFADYEPTENGPAFDNTFYLFWETEEWQTEYDVPQAEAGTLPEDKVNRLTTTFTARDIFGGWGTDWACAQTPAECLERRRNCSYITAFDCGAGPGLGELPPDGRFRLLFATMHAHLGFLRGTLVNKDSGEVLCQSVPEYGAADAAHDEEGYVVSILPCLWNAGGDPSLPPPPVLNLDTTLLSIAEYNSSSHHYGVMALWDMRGAWVPPGPIVHV